MKFLLAAALLAAIPHGAGVAGEPTGAARAAVEAHARLVVITDIGTEPDDMQSMVRLLTYANEIEIEALIATTSGHLRNRTYNFLIEERIDAYGNSLDNLRAHDPRYPDAENLRSRVAGHLPVYGMAGVGDGKDSDASRSIIAAVDKPDRRPVWVSIWGGASPLAQALWTVRATRSPEEVEKFVAKLRVYSISDQDDTGAWMRANFPRLFWVSSMHAMTQYGLSTWVGISAAKPGADQKIVSLDWLNRNVRTHGALGTAYPAPIFIMEGDSPSFLYLVPNGLGSSEHPDWGSWGGRYGRITPYIGLWTDTQDTVTGVDGKTYTGNSETVWRWREAFQNDFAARMDWSVTPHFKDANHPPKPLLNGIGGTSPLRIEACPDAPIKLSAAGSNDPDGDTLTYRWFRYGEVSGLWSPALHLSSTEGTNITVTVPRWTQPAGMEMPGSYYMHIILEVTDNGAPALTRYRRAILSVPTRSERCGVIEAGPSAPEIRPGSTIEVVDPASLGEPSVALTSIGELLDNSATRAVIEKHMPGLAQTAGASPQARGFSLRTIQHFDARLTDEVLAKIEAELGSLNND
ncbi:MAG: DUF1593 domain-containing protein [Novosphingobium sp.]|nr:DUF1593 domain-containing protein [Novosphingobium sp.]